MDISQCIAKLKQEPGFQDQVGMVLVHNGVVRNWSRGDGSRVDRIKVVVDQAKVEAIRQEVEAREGIFRVVIEARSGEYVPGDDLLFLVVAGDIREHVKPALADLLDRIKSEAVTKEELAS
jgi:molybdopterin synthase catalytic subunit